MDGRIADVRPFWRRAPLAGVARKAGAPPWIGWLAAALLLLEPEVAAFARLFRPEALHLALLLLAMLLAQHLTYSRDEGLQAPVLALLGIALGLAISMKSLLLPFAPLLLWPVVMRSGKSARLLRERFARADAGDRSVGFGAGSRGSVSAFPEWCRGRWEAARGSIYGSG